jgi:type I restriction enzyme S subunit
MALLREAEAVRETAGEELSQVLAELGVGLRMSVLPSVPKVALGDALVLQRGNDLPTAARRLGSVPVVGANGPVGWHDQAISNGPGVLVGRSGSVGKVSWVDGPFWPLNTSLWVKDFRGNDPRFIYYLLSSLPLADFAAGVSVPTLNRNLLSAIQVPVPSLDEQRRIARILSTIEKAKVANQATTEAVDTVFRSSRRALLGTIA